MLGTDWVVMECDVAGDEIIGERGKQEKIQNGRGRISSGVFLWLRCCVAPKYRVYMDRALFTICGAHLVYASPFFFFFLVTRVAPRAQCLWRLGGSDFAADDTEIHLWGM